MTTVQFTNTQTSSLYEQDFLLWLETTVNQLKSGHLSEVDLENLIEELESMGRSEKQSLESNLRVVLMHLLKYQYQPNKRSNSWLYSIYEHRVRIQKAFKDSPSLKRYYLEIFDDCYQDARKEASLETGLSLDIFPVSCPFSREDTLNSEFLPN